MKRTFVLLILAFLWLTSCGPSKTYVSVESKGKTDNLIPFEGRRLSVISMVRVGDRDSALVSELGMGVAQKIESELGLGEGALGVYAVPMTVEGGSESGTLDLLAVQTESDLLISIDSLSVGSFILARGGENVVQVSLPVIFNVQAYDFLKLESIYCRQVVDTVVWTVMGEGQVPNSMAIAQANAHLKEAFRGVGEKVSEIFLPSWNQEERMILCFSGSKWEAAYYLAYDFKWEQAIDIWLDLVKSGSPMKQGAAAYNLAVACEILGRYDIAHKWLDFAESKCYFAQMTTLRKKLQER